MNDTKYSLTDLEQETHFLSFPQLRESPGLVLHPVNKPIKNLLLRGIIGIILQADLVPMFSPSQGWMLICLTG